MLIGIGLLVMLIGLGFIQFAKTETKASIAYGLGLVSKFILGQQDRVSEKNWGIGTFLKYFSTFDRQVPKTKISSDILVWNMRTSTDLFLVLGLIFMFAIEIYAWIVVVSLFRKMAMIANFNNGMVLPIQQPISARPIARPMSSPISTSDNGFLNEGYNSENPANYNIWK